MNEFGDRAYAAISRAICASCGWPQPSSQKPSAPQQDGAPSRGHQAFHPFAMAPCSSCGRDPNRSFFRHPFPHSPSPKRGARIPSLRHRATRSHARCLLHGVFACPNNSIYRHEAWRAPKLLGSATAHASDEFLSPHSCPNWLHLARRRNARLRTTFLHQPAEVAASVQGRFNSGGMSS